jgi:hypothetical protein
VQCGNRQNGTGMNPELLARESRELHELNHVTPKPIKT